MLSWDETLLKVADRVLPLTAKVPGPVQRSVLQRVVNRVFAEQIADGAFDILEGRWLRLEVKDLGLSWRLTRVPSGLMLLDGGPADIVISGNWREFLLLASRQEDPDTLFFRRRLMIEGDTELGLAIKNLLDSLDPEHLPSWLWQSMERAGRLVQGVATTPSS